MLSEEEKAINEVLLSVIEAYSGYEGLQKISEEYKNTKIVLNLIEKQQKEIEKLKEKIKTFKIEDENIYLQFGQILSNKRWKDKIKAKLEELKDGTYDAKIVLKSLLEKE